MTVEHGDDIAYLVFIFMGAKLKLNIELFFCKISGFVAQILSYVENNWTAMNWYYMITHCL